MDSKKVRRFKNRLIRTAILSLLILSTGCGQKDSAYLPANTQFSALGELKSSAMGAAASVSEPVPESITAPETTSFKLKNAAMIECKFAFREPFRGIVLKNHRLQECVYEQLGKEDGTPLYEEELADYRGLLRESDYYSLTIANGQELDFVRTYFDLDSFYDFFIKFTPDLHDWTAAQLDGLRDLQKPVQIAGTKDTIPAEVLIFFTGTDELTFYNIADVTGTLPPGRTFPDTVRDVTLYSSGDTPCTFENLFACMQDSNIEFLSVHRSSQIRSGFPFPLDAAAGMKSLVQLSLNEERIEVKNKECLSESSLQYLTGFVIDEQTDTSIFQLFPQLTTISCSVTADANLSFVSNNEAWSLRLFFCPAEIEFDSPLYPDGEPAVFPAFDEALGWRESGDTDNFLGIYQRFMDEGRKIECFSIRCRNEDYGKEYAYPYPLQNVRTFLRVTDGAHVQQFLPEPRDSEYVTFGDYQTDPVYLEDINFDGIKDITLGAGSFGNSQWTFEYGWIYDPESGLYLPSNSFQSITNPSVDTEHQLVRSAWRNNAVSHGWAIYRYDKVSNSYRLERELIEDDVTYHAAELMPDLQIPEDGRLWEWEETIYDQDGVTVLENERYYALVAPGLQTEYPDAYDRFHEPDSYWGY